MLKGHDSPTFHFARDRYDSSQKMLPLYKLLRKEAS
jgi:hypothetical protein